MKQSSPFEDREPIAGNTDPVSSHIAARQITQDGSRGRMKAKVLEALKTYPGRTSAELAVAAVMDRYTVARRLPDLMHDGLAEQGEMRKCLVTGRWAVTWRVIK